MNEAQYQSKLVKKIRRRLPGCLILKNDSGALQGIPDLLILYLDRWAMLEVKAGILSPEQPNQRYYVEILNNMSFAAFIYPENEEEVLDELQLAFRPRRAARLSQR